MALASFGSLADLIPAEGEESPEIDTPDLPGIALQRFTVRDTKDSWLARRAELYMVGVAVDASAEIKFIPLGFDKLKDYELVRSVGRDEQVTYLGEGLPLVLPPTHGFLAMRLLMVDSDRGARDAAEV